MDGYPNPEAAMHGMGAKRHSFGGPPPSFAELLSVAGWRAREIETPEPLLGELVTNTTRMFIGGPTGLGKTHLGMAMAHGMASGQGFLHWKAIRKARVLYIDGEMPRDLVQARLLDLDARHPLADAAANLFFLCSEDFETLAHTPGKPDLGSPGPLNTPEGRAFVLGVIDRLGGVDVVVFDNRMSLLAGDMKEEIPWTDTMPLVKELTRRRIAQIWFDHMGHNAEHIYGSKTKEWQMDVVAVLKAVENPEAEISFRMEFTKARRRQRSNWQDFEAVTITLADDVWAGSIGKPKAARTLDPDSRQAQYLRVLRDLFATEDVAQNRCPQPGMGIARTVTRDQFREALRAKGLVGQDRTGPLSSGERSRIRDITATLESKGFVGMNKDLIWLLD